MWWRIRNQELGERLPQVSGVQPTSGQALELAQISAVRPNVLRHLLEEQQGPHGDRNFRAAIGDVPEFRIPGISGLAITDLSWSYLPTIFAVTVTEDDDVIELAYIPDAKDKEVNLFLPLLFDNREIEVWIDLRGYWGNESFITDAFLRPNYFHVNAIRGSWNATIRLAHQTRRRAGVLFGRVLVRKGQPGPNFLVDDFTMEPRLAHSESAYPAQALQVPRLETTSRPSNGEACAVWVHGTLSCALEGIKDLPKLPNIPMYRFEHDTFHEIGENAAELAALINQLDYKRTYLLAHSRGGLVARFCQQLLSNRFGRTSNVITFGTPHLGTPVADGAAGGLALAMRAGDFIVNGVPYSSEIRRIASMFVGIDLPPGIKAMRPSSETLRTSAMLLNQPFESWAGVYRDIGGAVGYGQDVSNVLSGMFGPTEENDLVVATLSALGGNTTNRVETSHFDYFKQLPIQTLIAALT